jgi:hypothetical protein
MSSVRTGPCADPASIEDTVGPDPPRESDERGVATLRDGYNPEGSTVRSSAEEAAVADKAKQIDVVYKESKGLWIAVQGGLVVDMAVERDDLLVTVATMAEESDGTTVRIHDGDGQVEEERTYPIASGTS